jgi:ornithine cyclodeaminase/alanine dehydrogenase-like protein (mu-crystallin family)
MTGSTGSATASIAIVNSRAVEETLSLARAIELVTLAMKELSAGLVTAPERTGMAVASEGKMVLMPGAMSHIQRFGIKTLSLFSTASERGLPGHQGIMLLFDGVSGRPLCAIDSHSITALRTAAASAVATRALSRSDSCSVALLGCGSLARLHIEAMLQVRSIDCIYVWSRARDKAQAFAAQMAHRLSANVKVVDSVQAAIESADIICTLTGADVPLVKGKWLRPGQHLNLVGASTRASREVDDETVARGYYVADCRSHVLEQAGEFRHALKGGYVGENHIAGEIGEILNGSKAGRSHPSMITIYKSLGHVAQDLRVADGIFAQLDRSKHVVWAPWPV